MIYDPFLPLAIRIGLWFLVAFFLVIAWMVVDAVLITLLGWGRASFPTGQYWTRCSGSCSWPVARGGKWIAERRGTRQSEPGVGRPTRACCRLAERRTSREQWPAAPIMAPWRKTAVQPTPHTRCPRYWARAARTVARASCRAPPSVPR